MRYLLALGDVKVIEKSLKLALAILFGFFVSTFPAAVRAIKPNISRWITNGIPGKLSSTSYASAKFQTLSGVPFFTQTIISQAVADAYEGFKLPRRKITAKI